MASRLHQLLASHIADHPLAQHARLGLAQFTLPAQQLAAAGALEPGALRRGDIDWCDLLLITGRQAADGLELAIQPRLEVLALALIDDLDIGPYPQLGAPLFEGIGVHHRGGLRRLGRKRSRNSRPQARLHQPGPAGDQGHHQGHQDHPRAGAALPGGEHLTRHLQPQQLFPEPLEPLPELVHGAQASHGGGMTGPHASPAVAC